MAVNSKLITLPSLLLKSGLKGRGPTYSSLLASLDLDSLRDLFTKTFTPGQGVVVEAEELDSISYAMYSMSFEQFLRSKVQRFVDTFNPQKEVTKVVNDIFDQLTSSAYPNPESYSGPKLYPLSRAKVPFLMSENPKLVA